MKKQFMMLVMIAVLGGIAAPCMGDVLDNALGNWFPVNIDGRVSRLDQTGFWIIEQKVIVVDRRISGREIRTELLDLEGNVLDLDILRNGMKVVVQGAASREDTDDGMVPVVIARRIYLADGADAGILKLLMSTPVESW